MWTFYEQCWLTHSVWSWFWQSSGGLLGWECFWRSVRRSDTGWSGCGAQRSSARLAAQFRCWAASSRPPATHRPLQDHTGKGCLLQTKDDENKATGCCSKRLPMVGSSSRKRERFLNRFMAAAFALFSPSSMIFWMWIRLFSSRSIMLKAMAWLRYKATENLLNMCLIN